MILNNNISNICVCVCFWDTNPKYLEECFFSIDNAIWFFKRYYTVPIEVHVLDDGSTKANTLEMFYDIIMKKYPYIKYWKHNHNTTLATAINSLHEHTPEDALVIYIDSDDMMVYNRILIQYEIFMKYNQWRDITMCATMTITPNHIVRLDQHQCLKYWHYTILKNVEDNIYENIIVHPSIAYKINHIRQYSIKYDDQFKCSQDFDFYLNCLSHHLKILLIPDALTFWRRYPDIQKPDFCDRNYFKEEERVIDKYKDFIKRNDYS